MVGAYNDLARVLLTAKIPGARLPGIHESIDAYSRAFAARRRSGSSRGRCHERINKSKTGSKPRLFRGLFKLGDRPEQREHRDREYSDSVTISGRHQQHQRRWQRRKRRREERDAASFGRQHRAFHHALWQLDFNQRCSWQRCRSEQQRWCGCGRRSSWQRRHGSGSGRRLRAASSRVHGASLD